MRNVLCDCGAIAAHTYTWDNEVDVEYLCDDCWEELLRREEQAAKDAEETRIKAERTYHANMD